MLLASGTTFPDALAAGQLVAATRTPLLLTDPGQLPSATRAGLQARPDADVVVVGGPVAVSAEVAEATGRDVRRIAGGDRYATARVLAGAAVASGASPARTLVASGERFPEALGAGAFVARALAIGGPVAVTAEVVAELHGLARG